MPELTEQEMIEILEDIARNGGNAAARISAIKTLREMRNGVQPTAETFQRLDELTERRRFRTKAA